MEVSERTRAIIIGGGIGGLTAGIALQRVGFDVVVLERAKELQEVGSGLPLWTNALRALETASHFVPPAPPAPVPSVIEPDWSSIM